VRERVREREGERESECVCVRERGAHSHTEDTVSLHVPREAVQDGEPDSDFDSSPQERRSSRRKWSSLSDNITDECEHEPISRKAKKLKTDKAAKARTKDKAAKARSKLWTLEFSLSSRSR